MDIHRAGTTKKYFVIIECLSRFQYFSKILEKFDHRAHWNKIKAAFKLMQVLMQASALQILYLEFLFFKWKVLWQVPLLQDLQSQLASQKLKEQSILFDQTDYTTVQGSNHLQYPFIIIQCTLANNITPNSFWLNVNVGNIGQL